MPIIRLTYMAPTYINVSCLFKGKDLLFLKDEKFIRIFYKGGAEITDGKIQSYAKAQVLNKRNKYPVILFWFGTCSLTTKSNGLFVAKDDLEEVVKKVIQTYKDTKDKLLKLNHRAKIFFLQCPYYSLSMFNNHRKKKFQKGFFQHQQGRLNSAVDLHNQLIREINCSCNTPNFNNDFSTRSHSKKGKPRKAVDYSQLRDGCHIGRKLAELWLLRIHRLIYRI